MSLTSWHGLLKRHPLRSLVLALIIVLFIPEVTQAHEHIATLIRPEEGTEVIGRRPTIRFVITEPFIPEMLLVLLDETDITSLIKASPDGFVFTPVEVLPPGQHTLDITIHTRDGREIRQELTFSTRHTKRFETAYTSNEMTAVYETVVEKPEDTENIPNSKIESNLKSSGKIREKGWDVTLNTNIRYLDQSIPVSEPLKKGFNLVNYLLQAQYTGEYLQTLLEIGDIYVNESASTIQNLLRRGGRFSLQYKDLKIKSFIVRSRESYRFDGDTGIGGGLDDHIFGVSAEAGLLSERIRLRSIYVTGGEEDGSFGIWAPGGGRKGSVLALVFKADVIEQRLSAEAEIDLSEFDADTSDEFSAENDRSYRLKMSGYSGRYSYQALYEYVGPAYEVIGNQFLPRNREGFMLNGGANFQTHSINLSFSRYNDNVEGDDLYPRIYTYQGTIDYSFNKFPNLPMGLSYQKAVINSTMEPDPAYTTSSDTDTFSGRINYMRGRWNIGFQVSHSIQNDRTEDSNDTDTTTYTIMPVFSSEHLSVMPNLSFNRSTYHLTGVYTDTYTINLELRFDTFHQRMTYELSGTYNRIKSSDDSMDQDTINTQFRIAYLIRKDIWGYLNPSVGIRGLYNKMIDRAYEQRDEELVLLLVLSSTMSFSF